MRGLSVILYAGWDEQDLPILKKWNKTTVSDFEIHFYLYMEKLCDKDPL